MKKKNDITKKIAFCGLMGALAVVIMALGSLIEVLDLSMSVIASVAVILIVVEVGYTYAWLTYLASGVLALLLSPNKFAAGIFLVFTGFYPIIKSHIEKLENKVVRWILKLVSAHVIMVPLVFLLDRFGFIIVPEGLDFVFYTVFYLLGLATFILYDIALTRLVSLYFYKFRERLGIYKLLK